MTADLVAIILHTDMQTTRGLLKRVDIGRGSSVTPGYDAPTITDGDSAIEAARRYGFATSAEREHAALEDVYDATEFGMPHGKWLVRFDMTGYRHMFDRL